ncbi:hypothetical protein LRC484719_54130 [Mycobacterium riyadhense]
MATGSLADKPPGRLGHVAAVTNPLPSRAFGTERLAHAQANRGYDPTVDPPDHRAPVRISRRAGPDMMALAHD